MSDDEYINVTSIGDSHQTRVVGRRGSPAVRAAYELNLARPRPGSFYCEGGSGHDDPDGSGLCIKCGGVSDGGPLAP